MSTYLLVRGLWVALALVAVASAAILLAPTAPDRVGEDVEPIPVPGRGEEMASTLSTTYLDIFIPEWNVFDPTGEPWELGRAPAPKSEAKPVAEKFQVKGVAGVLRLPGLQGVLTDKGFVEVGETFEGAEIRGIRSGEVLFSASGKEQVLVVDPERGKRRASFEQYGFPFLPAGGRE